MSSENLAKKTRLQSNVVHFWLK